MSDASLRSNRHSIVNGCFCSWSWVWIDFVILYIELPLEDTHRQVVDQAIFSQNENKEAADEVECEREATNVYEEID